jgi:hypothetical protein
MVELRLNDLRQTVGARGAGRGTEPPVAERLFVQHPTLLETTAVFSPIVGSAGTAYVVDADQVLKRVRTRTNLDSMPPEHVTRVGNPLATPFALMGLPMLRGDVARCLAYERFARSGLDAVVVDLTRMARMTLSVDWRRDLLSLLDAIGSATLPHRPGVVVLCEDAFMMLGAEAVLRSPAGSIHRPRPIRCGALLLRSGILQVPGQDAASMSALQPLPATADVKDAGLRPIRERLLGLARRLREAGHAAPAHAVGRTLRVLSAFASLPLGLVEARNTADVLFPGDGHEEVKARTRFFPTSRLQALADAEAAAPEFAADLREAFDAVKSQIARWEGATPVSLKLRTLLDDKGWNARDVLLVLPDARTTDVFLVSDRGIDCSCTVIDAAALVEHAKQEWRRLLVVRPEPTTMRALLTLPTTPGQVLLLGDCAGMPSLTVELEQLASIAEFAPFAARARALLVALGRGGADATLDVAEAEYHYRVPTVEDFIDLAQASDGYAGPTIRLRSESGARAAYRPGGDVLLFTPDAVRPFTPIAAQDVQIGDSILVLRKEIRDRLSEALLRSRKTAVQLRVYHERIAQYRGRLIGATRRAKAREVLAAMRAIDPTIGDHETPNIIRWLSVEPSDAPQPPRAARDRRRFRVFVQAAGLDIVTADAFWNLAIVPVRAYSAVEGHAFNRRIVQFVVDPEGVAAGAGWNEYRDLWQAVVDSVECVTDKEVTHA